MTFESALKTIPALAGKHRLGLQALKAVDRARVNLKPAKCVRASVEVDETLRPFFPQDPRWDYVLAQPPAHGNRKERLVWLEVHPANGTGNIAEMESKLQWLKEWLKGKQLELFPRRFVWVSSGRCEITPRSPRMRQLIEQGLEFRGRCLFLA